MPEQSNPTTPDGEPLVIGEWPPERAVAALREIGADDKADKLEEHLAKRDAEAMGAFGNALEWVKSWIWTPLFMHTSHRVGFLEPSKEGGTKPVVIQDAETISPDTDLIGKRINLSLMSLRALDYPGTGEHNVLFNFTARNQIKQDDSETVAFNLTARVQEGEEAGVINYLIFDGLTVGKDGIAFEGKTVNVNNSDDEAFLETLDSDAFKEGLKLLETAQPVVKPFTQLGISLAKSIGKRNRNRTVQEFKIGLDFERQAMSALLRTGVYLIAQTPPPLPGQEGLDWQDWVYLPGQRRIALKDDHAQPLPANFVAISVRRA